MILPMNKQVYILLSLPTKKARNLNHLSRRRERKRGKWKGGGQRQVSVPCLTRYGKGPTVETPLCEQPVKICS